MLQNTVVSQSGVTSGQLRNFFHLTESGKVTFANFQSYMENPNRFVQDGISIEEAIKAFGAKKVITVEQASRAWGQDVPDTAHVSVSESLLQSAIDSNRAGFTDFRLVYCFGLSFCEQSEILGSDPTPGVQMADRQNRPPFSSHYSIETLAKAQENGESWATSKTKPGYKLIDYRLRFLGMHWGEQTRKLAELGRGFKRANGRNIMEGCISFYKTHAYERLLEGRSYVCEATSPGRPGRLLKVGMFQCHTGFSVRLVENPLSEGEGMLVSRE